MQTHLQIFLFVFVHFDSDNNTSNNNKTPIINDSMNHYYLCVNKIIIVCKLIAMIGVGLSIKKCRPKKYHSNSVSCNGAVVRYL